jgi:pentatricopeptide repeat protein
MSRHENIANMLPVDKQLLLSAETVIQAFKALLKCRYDPDELGARVRDWERCIGLLKSTPLTDPLSLRLLEANGKAGNVGRVLSLLHLRKARQYPAVRREFVYAVTSLQAANWAARRQRNIFVGDREQAAVDNPIRWLDAIMLNMHERDYPLTVHLANRMLQTFAAGKTGKAVHHFYRVVRHALETLPTEEQPAVTDSMPHVWADGLQNYKYQPVKVRLKYNAASPPFYKVPATVKGKMLFSDTDKRNGQFKLERESDPEWSLALTAAFAFTESLQHGACGHDGITLNRGSYNALVKACCHRGAMWRALKLLDTDMVQDDNTTPNIVTYNHILGGLARVGDVVTAQEYYKKLLNAGLEPNAFTVRAIVDGLLNLGDLPAAVTVVQDFFNQHNVLPPYTTHIKILEFCLARDMIYEAKRYVYFVQQLWKWEPNKYHSEQFIKLMHATQRNTQLQKPALQQLFAYFGETLEEKDFL